jgi:hypothetical protein
MVTYYKYEVIKQQDEFQAFSLLGYETPLSDAVTLLVARTSNTLFGWIGTKGICIKSGGIPAYNINDLSVTNIVVDAPAVSTPSEAIGLLYAYLT